MQEIIPFAASVILISISGVMAPGPLFVANVYYGTKGGLRSGLKMSIGHTIVELPLIILLGVGAFSMEAIPEFREIIAILGALGLFAFAGLQLRGALRARNVTDSTPKYGPVLAGVLLSGLNPFFIIWWLTIGFKLISDSMVLWSFWGIAIMFGLHIWMDYAWLGTTAHLSGRAMRFLSGRNHRFFIIGISAVLVYFGFSFLVDVI